MEDIMQMEELSDQEKLHEAKKVLSLWKLMLAKRGSLAAAGKSAEEVGQELEKVCSKPNLLGDGTVNVIDSLEEWWWDEGEWQWMMQVEWDWEKIQRWRLKHPFPVSMAEELVVESIVRLENGVVQAEELVVESMVRLESGVVQAEVLPEEVDYPLSNLCKMGEFLHNCWQ